MFVVSDTSPLHYFIAVQPTDVLPRLFTNVHVPPAVIRELSHPGTPVQIRQWVEKRPTWLMQVPLMRFLDPRLAATLDQGEAEAIQLAEEQQADLLLLDERTGREIAGSRNLALTGALGVLGPAYQKRLLDDPIPILAEMRKEGFRIREELAGLFAQLLNTRYSR